MDDRAPPVGGYDTLGAREAMRLVLELPREALLRVQSYEQRNLRRTHVLGAIRRALARLDAIACPPAQGDGAMASRRR
jgi:hypothetical protein